VKQAPRSELPALRSCVLNALTLAYEFRGGGDEESVDLMDEANGVLLAVVMKLSESQFRPLYAKLREWRGDVVSEGDVALKRCAFWSLSAVLSTELRSIFLPCLRTVLSDSVDDRVSKIVLNVWLDYCTVLRITCNLKKSFSYHRNICWLVPQTMVLQE
jgi:hypothetical protein